jgi:periplasmic divalent cation tolerance protein
VERGIVKIFTNSPGVVLSTTGNRDEADRLATALVERQLAGCVQILGPITSVYRWQGAVERGEEWLCVIKTLEEKYPALEAAIKELHSYDTPQIVMLPITAGSAEYLAWLAAACSN